MQKADFDCKTGLEKRGEKETAAMWLPYFLSLHRLLGKEVENAI